MLYNSCQLVSDLFVEVVVFVPFSLAQNCLYSYVATESFSAKLFP